MMVGQAEKVATSVSLVDDMNKTPAGGSLVE